MPQRINSELFVRPKSALVRDQPVLLMVLGAQAVCWCALHRIAWKWLIDHAATLLGLAGNMRPIPSLSSIFFQLAILENLKWSWRNTHLHILGPASMCMYASIARYWYFRLQHPCLLWSHYLDKKSLSYNLQWILFCFNFFPGSILNKNTFFNFLYPVLGLDLTKFAGAF